MVRKRNKQKEKRKKGQDEKKVEILQGIQKEKEVDLVMEDAPSINLPSKERKRDAAPVIPLVTKRQLPQHPRDTLVGQSLPKKPTKQDNGKYVSMKAFVVHGVPYHRPISDAIKICEERE